MNANIQTTKQDLVGLPLVHLQALMERLGEKPFRARQIFEWMHKKGAVDFESMSNLSAELRKSLAENFELGILKVHRKQVSQRDGTTKFLLACRDSELVEAVFLPHEGRNTACISTQVGCAMGCRFCATGDSGFARNLSPAEIVGQISAIERECGQPVHNLVYMGMGEPLHNWEAVKEALEVLLDPAGRQWGPRHITLSTCGVVPGIDQLTASGLKVRLAISLHSAVDEVRSSIMPINRRYPLKELMRAARDYQKATGLQLTFEVALFGGVNDSDLDAVKVARLVRGVECKVNLIPYNPVSEQPFKVPEFSRVASFQNVLRHAGIITMIRTEKGGDIDAACGQLRRREAGEKAA
ncbi:MAG: 23S rRNA (adenine(2503)-C(2))-methyltransferase RlmN [candidate division FCPU426 bacterium]